MYNLLFVVHRYPPYAGGSEYNTHRLAKAAVNAGHNVCVLSDEHQGDFEGVRVTSDRNIVTFQWDLIIVHGSCSTQDYIHAHAGWDSPVYYMLIEPPKNFTARELGTENATWIGYGTTQDYEFIQSRPLHIRQKAVPYVYGVPGNALGTPGRIKSMVGVTTPYMMLATGGYWPHKQFDELVTAFNEADNPLWSLVLFGYDTRFGNVPSHGNERVIPIVDAEPSDIYDALADADLYIMNSVAEGYGLTLLEAMYNKTHWISRNIAAGYDLSQLGFGHTYDSYDQLVNLLRQPPDAHDVYLSRAQRYIQTHHMVEHSLASILAVL